MKLSKPYRYLFFSLILFLGTVSTYAQSSATSSVVKTDSLSASFKQKLSTPQLTNDSVYTNILNAFNAHADSLNGFKQVLNKDSLKLDSLSHWYQQQQAKVLSLSLSQKEKGKQLDSLKAKYENANALLLKEQQKHLSTISEKQSKMNNQLDKWKTKWESLKSRFDSLALSPDQDEIMPQDELNIQPVGAQLPDLQAPTLDTKVNIPSPTLEQLPTKANITDLETPTSPSLADIRSELDIPEFEQIQSKLRQIEGMESQISQYKKDLDSLDRAKMEQHAETFVSDKVRNLEEVKSLEKGKSMSDAEMQKIQQYENMMRKYQDKKYIAQQMEQKSKNLANDVIKDKLPQVKDAQTQLAKTQKKYKSFSSLSDAKKHRFNALHGKPFADRFFYGFSLQFQKQTQQDIFFVPQAYYRINGRISAGLGVTYRTQFQTKPEFEWMNTNTLWGGRSFVKIGLMKGLFLHTEFEYLSLEKDEIANWSGRWMGGIGKSFRVSKRVKGEALILNNFNHKSDEVYHSQLNVRTGFFLSRSLK